MSKSDASKLLKLLAARQQAAYELAKFASAIQKKYETKTNEFYIVACNLHGRTAKALMNMAAAFDVVGDEMTWCAFGWPHIQTYIRITTVSSRKKLLPRLKRACQQNGTLKSPRMFFTENRLVTKLAKADHKRDLHNLAINIAEVAKEYYPELLSDLTARSRATIKKVT